jgi:hypothetical protein
MTKLIIEAPNRDSDPSSLTSNLEFIKNGFLDRKGSIISLAGKKVFCDLGIKNKVDNIFVASQNYRSTNSPFVYAVCGGQICAVTDRFGSFTDITGDSLESERSVSFTELFSGSDVLSFFANGGKIIYSNQGNTTAYHTSANAPDNCDSIAGFDTYLIFNKVGENSFGFSNPKLPLTIDATDEYDAEMGVDNIEALHVCDRDLYIWGENSIETWQNAGTPGDPFLRRVNSAFFQNGIFAKNCISIADLGGRNIPIYLDKRRRVMALAGNSSIEIGVAYNRFIQALSSISDARSFILNTPGTNFYVISIPSQKLTLAYDLLSGAWYEFGEPSNMLNYNIYNGYCSVYMKYWDKYLVGGDDGIIYEVSPDNTAGISMLIETGHINWGDDSKLKKCTGLTARIKRGAGKTSLGQTVSSDDQEVEPSFLHRFKDNGKNEWSDWIKHGLGKRGDTEFNVDLFRSRGGNYYTRKHQLLFPDDAQIVLSGIYEKVKIAGET